MSTTQWNPFDAAKRVFGKASKNLQDGKSFIKALPDQAQKKYAKFKELFDLFAGDTGTYVEKSMVDFQNELGKPEFKMVQQFLAALKNALKDSFKDFTRSDAMTKLLNHVKARDKQKESPTAAGPTRVGTGAYFTEFGGLPGDVGLSHAGMGG